MEEPPPPGLRIPAVPLEKVGHQRSRFLLRCPILLRQVRKEGLAQGLDLGVKMKFRLFGRYRTWNLLVEGCPEV